jgi:hypothetical protein
MARRATIKLNVHGKVVQSVPLDQQDIECLIDGLRQVTPWTQRIDPLVDLLQQIRNRDQGSVGASG